MPTHLVILEEIQINFEHSNKLLYLLNSKTFNSWKQSKFVEPFHLLYSKPLV